MTLRPGSYNAARPKWRGVIRSDSYPAYVCVHNHSDQRGATACAKAALQAIKENGGSEWPAGWMTYESARRSGDA